MKTEKSIFKILSSIFKKHNIQPVLVGGYALIANKVQRMTFDIDFLISEDDFSKIELEIIKIGFSIFHRQEAFVQFKSEKQGLIDTDFLISDPETVEIIVSQGKKFIIDNEEFIVPSPIHLIAMKLHSISFNKNREIKDLPDIIQLVEMNNININSKEIEDYFKKYKSIEILDKVRSAINHKNEKNR